MRTKSTNEILERIIKKKILCYFISPHLDDAVFSAGALISYLVKERVPIKVINVFTKAGKPPYTISQRVYLNLCGYKNVRKLYKTRIKEDKKAMNELGIDFVNLEYTDSLWREKENMSHISKFLGRFVPEVKMEYPTYFYHIKKGRISRNEKHLKENIKQSLQKEIKIDGPNIIFCPSGIGKHVDHLIIRDICISSFSNIIYYCDYPYCLKKDKDIPLVLFKLEKFFNTYNLGIKEKLIQKYATQIKSMSEVDLKTTPEEYYIGNRLNERI